MSPPPPRRLRGAIVDLDGTLVDTLGDFTAALQHMLAELGLPPIAPQKVALLVGKGSEYLIRRTLEEVGAPAALYEPGWAAYQAAYRRINGRFAQAYPGAAEGLAALRAQGLRLACLTNKPTEFARSLLEGLGLAGEFEHVFGGDAYERKKPDPLPMLRTCDALALPPGEVLAIGDSSNDAGAARAAGCALALVTYGYNHGHCVLELDADVFVDRLDDLPRWIAAGGPPAGGRGG